MRTFKILSFASLSILLLLPFLSDARPGDKLTEQDIFARTVYPFMRQNCVQCHGEQAIYPVGPSHSHSDLKTAYTKFSKFINHSDMANSRFIKFASNKHFCLEYDTHCDKMDAIVSEITKRFNVFSTQARALQKTDTMIGTVASGDSQTITQIVKLDGASYIMVINLKKFSDDYRKIQSIFLKSDTKGAVSFDGIEVRINGRLPQKLTGLEKFSRKLNFENTEMVTRLTASRETIVNLKDGERIDIKLSNFKTVGLIPSPICENKDQWITFVNKLIDTRGLRDSFLINTFGNTKADIVSACEQVALQLNLDTPSLSIFLQQAPKEARKAGLAGIRKLTSKLEQQPGASRQNIVETLGNYSTTCYKLADKSIFCFGDAFQFGTGFRSFPADLKIRQFSVGVYEYAYLTEDGFIVSQQDGLIGNSFPTIPKNQGSYQPPGKVKDLQVGYALSCFLTEENELYCGGETMKEVGKNADEFHLIATNIEKFSIKLSSVLMTSTTNQIYWFGNSKVQSNGFGLSTKPEAQLVELGFKARGIYQGFNEVCFQDMNGDFRCYSQAPTALFKIQKNGDAINGDMKFKSIGIMSTQNAICGVDGSNELYCLGTFPEGFKNAKGASSSERFEKIANTPKNIKSVAFGELVLCLTTTDNLIYCAGGATANAYSLGLLRGSNPNTDAQGRAFFRGNDTTEVLPTLSPYIAMPIR